MPSPEGGILPRKKRKGGLDVKKRILFDDFGGEGGTMGSFHANQQQKRKRVCLGTEEERHLGGKGVDLGGHLRESYCYSEGKKRS